MRLRKRMSRGSGKGRIGYGKGDSRVKRSKEGIVRSENGKDWVRKRGVAKGERKERVC